ncbi:SAV_915 family protein [Nocardioides sp. CPCC 206347]|uniref:SAV_915 family protein n=1 Tax=Nocardioides sp. CPCC 206347 TaxID=3406463 RepID=UPI003B43473E
MSDQPSSGQLPAPPVVYLPVEIDADGKVTDFKMLKLGDGRIALLAYTALDRFINAWGDHQSWLLFESRKVDDIKDAKHFDVKLLDVDVPEEFRPGPPAEAQA